MVSYVIEQDENGEWCASATIAEGIAAFGEGETPEAALADVQAGLKLLLDESPE